MTWMDLFGAGAQAGAREMLVRLADLAPGERLYPETALSRRSGVAAAAIIQRGAAATRAEFESLLPLVAVAVDPLEAFFPRHPLQDGPGLPSLLNALAAMGTRGAVDRRPGLRRPRPSNRRGGRSSLFS